ncbi:MAG: hypothetical protein WAQ28_17025 [Bacteroidia bacterium]
MSPKKLLLDNEYGRIELENESIIIATWKANILDLNTVQNAVSTRLEVVDGKSYPFLINIGSIKDSTKEARDFLASSEGTEGIIAGALLVTSTLENIMASIYIQFNKPIVPTKIFKDRAKAIEWLSKYK